LSNYTRGSDALTFTMPSDMKQVEDYAFAYSKLRSVTIPEGVVKLGNNIFAYSENLTSVNLPATLLETGMAFTYCPSLMEINVASGSFNHRTIDGALYRYRYDEEDNINILVAFPEGRTEQLSGGIYRIADNTEEIYDGAFNGNSKLNGVIIPNTVKRIGNWVLGGAENVKTLIIPDGCEVSWGAFEGSSLDSIYIQDKNLIENFENQTENIKVYTNKSEYESALLADTLTIVDGVLLSYTGSFDTIDLRSFTDITAIGENVFDGVNAEIILPDSITRVGYRAFADNPQITGELIYQLLENGAYIERHAFENCTGVTELVIPAVTNDINPGALTRLPNLRSITVEDENDSFIAPDSRALYTSDGKRLLTAAVGDGKVSLELSDGLETIDRDALYGYSSLMGTLSIPSTVTEIGDAAFAGLSQIENFAITGGESAGGFYTDEVDEAVKPTALYQDTTLMYYPAGHRATSYEVLDGTTMIGSYAFSENKKLTEVVLPNSVNVISDHAFKRCTGLRSINLPDSLTEIREYAFELCTSLISAQIPESISTIHDGVFVNCSALLNVSMPGVTTVNNIAFAGCKNLTKVDMPAAVDLRVSSFADCVQLSSALFGENVPYIHPTSFTNCDKIVVYYPEGAWSNAVIDGFFGNFIAKPYAIENLTKSDAQSSVTVAFAPDSTEDAESISVSVTTTSANTAEALNSVASDAVADTEESAAYNITLSSSDSTVTELDKPVLVKIPLPEGFTAEQKAKLVIIHEHISSDGTTENSIIADYFFVTEEDGTEYVCFRMNRFSTVKLTGVEETVHNHVYNKKHNALYHWNECDCGVEIDKEPHDKTLRFDKAEHWYECEVCGYKSEREAHAPTVVGKVSPTYDSVGYTGDTVCADCGYVISVGTVIPKLTYPIIIPPVDNGSGESSGTGESETGESSGTGGTEAPVVSDWENPFTDVSESDSFYDAVRFANENKLLIGVSDTEFGPSLTMNRAMFITVLGRADRVPENTIYSGSFEDVDEISWYSAYVSWAHENGIVKGYSDLAFGPFDCVTIEQSCVILARYAEYLGEDISVVRLGEDSGFDDISKISDWAADGVAWAVRNGIYNADGNSLRPDAPATRAEVAVMIYRLSEYFAANAN
ncbi:MAG: leucine-rich repeat protein, partial [Candidatus Flemingiibacterium sp.]